MHTTTTQDANRSTAGYTAQLAGFAAGLNAIAFDGDVLRHAKRHLIDTVGAMLAGSQLSFLTQVENTLSQLRSAGRIPVPGRRRCADLLDAVYLAATASHSGEVDDGFRQGSIHPGTVVVPAALLLGYQQKSSGMDVLKAVIAGYEAIAAISRYAHPFLRKKGFHPTAVVGPLGAAITASVLKRLEAPAIRAALGIAASSSSGLFAFSNGGADVKRLHPGHAAREGVFSVFLAEQGLSAPTTVLESRDGFFQAFVGADNLHEQAFKLPPEVPYAIANCYMKPYACCRHLQPSIDALLSILAREAIDAEEIDAIEVETYSIAASHANVPWNDTAEAQLSFPYVLAVAALQRQVTLQEFDPVRLNDAAANLLCSKIRVAASERMDAMYPATRPAKVTITAQGKKHECEVSEAKGDPTQPLSDAEVNDKFLTLAAPALGQKAASELLEQLWHIEDLKDITPAVDRMITGH
jgi:2-methylcitrate dehydratase PrpD